MARVNKSLAESNVHHFSQVELMRGSTAQNHMGEIWAAAHPGRDRSEYGSATLEPSSPVVARSHASIRLTYICGRFGIDGGGGIRIAFRFTADWGDLQFTNPEAENYVTASTSRGLPLKLRYAEDLNPRPWYLSLDAQLLWGHLADGDEITILFGDRSGGSPGLKMQSCCESKFRFLVLVDPIATGHFVPMEDSPSIAIIPGPAVRWWGALPSLRRPNERFHLGIRADDVWGNPASLSGRTLHLSANTDVIGLPETIKCHYDDATVSIEGLKCSMEGSVIITVSDESGLALARSNPLEIRDGDAGSYWADFHAQSVETVGINSIEEYFAYARHVAFLDVVSHQANDFQVTNAFWRHLNRLTAATHEPGRFVTFPGYEWSANTHLGGDRNVIYCSEDRPIFRSSHALIEDKSDVNTDANDARALFNALRGENAIVFAHCGGRWADLRAGHDGSLETAMEIHSSWGTFEWLMADALHLGYRVGVVSNSDGHKGRPGANHPGASYFVAYGGLTCVLASELTRDSIFESLRNRHHYATTGARIYVDLRASCSGGYQRFERDPAVFSEALQLAVEEAKMGDIVSTASPQSIIKFEIAAPSPIQRIELRDGTDVIKTVQPYTRDELGSRVRVMMSGAERRGKRAATYWKGRASLEGAKIRQCIPVNHWNQEFTIEKHADDCVIFDVKTAGNLIGFDLVLEDLSGAVLRVSSNLGSAEIDLSTLSDENRIFNLGGLDRELRVTRLPNANVHYRHSGTVVFEHKKERDSALWLCVTTEDGNQAWTSPVYVISTP